MKRLLVGVVAAAGAALAIFGFTWVWTGLDIVQVERGWSAVIAGATMLSAGAVIVVLAGVLWRLGQLVDLLRTSDRAVRPRPAAPVPAETAKVSETRATPPAPATHPADDGEKIERAVVGRHVSGDATYVMFDDGTVEAQTPEGVVTFGSLEALRAYTEEREALQTGA